LLRLALRCAARTSTDVAGGSWVLEFTLFPFRSVSSRCTSGFQSLLASWLWRASQVRVASAAPPPPPPRGAAHTHTVRPCGVHVSLSFTLRIRHVGTTAAGGAPLQHFRSIASRPRRRGLCEARRCAALRSARGGCLGTIPPWWCDITPGGAPPGDPPSKSTPHGACAFSPVRVVRGAQDLPTYGVRCCRLIMFILLREERRACHTHMLQKL
jgi:hypothetical protein